ncbi:MAG TPA: GerAB/ArcD/ProY family transporter [Bacillales bacterium]|nr:GerAB/ArcD/ProY family transporter [Bacillales bacterium]
MIKKENKVTPAQLFILIVQTEIGVSILSLPNSLFSEAKTDGWLSMLLAGAITQILILIIWKLNSRFESLTLFAICRNILGKWLGTLTIIIYTAYFCATAGITLILFVRMLSLWVLPRTPFWILMLLMVAAGMDIARENLRVLARFYTFTLIFLGVLLLFILYSLKDAHIIYLLPIGHSGLWNIFLGSKKAILSILGFEMILVIYPYVQGTPKQKLKAATFANLFVTLFYTMTIIACYLFFSPAQLPLLPEPVLYMFKAFTFTIIERVDLLFISIWVVIVSTSFMTYLYLSSNGIASLFKKESHAKFVPLAALVVFAAAFIPDQNELLITKINYYFEQASIIFIVLIPFILLLLSYLFRKKERGVKS